jgi:predicted DNA-binding transcriptional regulator YafY
MAQIGKTERILNLVSFLLKERRPAPWREIAGRVVGYDDGSDPKSLERRFERDKAALKEMGIQVEYYPPGAHEREGYMIPREACFLDRLELLPHEAALLNLVTELALRKGGSGFSGDLMSALQKLRFDAGAGEIPVRRPAPPPDAAASNTAGAPPPRKRGRPPKKKPALAAMAPAPEEDVPRDGPGATDPKNAFEASLLDLDLMSAVRGDPNVEPLAAALLANRAVAFTYYAIGPDETRRRTVDPYGLGFARGQWYLVGRDHLRDAIRCFRLDRIQGAVEPVGPERAFKIPPGFKVQEQIERPIWEMASAAPIEVTIEVGRDVAWFVEDLVAGKRPPEPGPDGSARVRLDVRDRAAFLRWVLAHGRHVRIVEPRDLRDELLALMAELEARHAAPRPAAPAAAAPTGGP